MHESAEVEVPVSTSIANKGGIYDETDIDYSFVYLLCFGHCNRCAVNTGY